MSGTVQNRDGVLLKGAEVIAGDLHALTNDSGAFVLPNIPGGSIFIVIRRIGYMPGTLAFESEPTLRAMTVAAVLTPTATTLGTIVIEGKTLDQGLWKNGFYKRQNLGLGHYFGPERMARAGMNLSTIISEVPAVRTQRRQGGVAIPMAGSGTNLCVLNVYLDGTFLPWANQVGIDNIISTSDVQAIEVYSRVNEVSAAFSSGKGTTIQNGLTMGNIALDGGNISCGAIMLWSKSTADTAQKK